MEIHPAEAEVFRADGQTGMTKQIVAFLNFVKAPITVSMKNSTLLLLLLLLLHTINHPISPLRNIGHPQESSTVLCSLRRS
jgi:hypothetical protein